KTNETSYTATKHSYEAKAKRLETLQQEQAELNKALPTEVVVLRKQLQANQPCPVCGATDHPFAKTLAVKNLQEEELERQKANVAKELETLTKDMEEIQKVLVATQTNVTTFTNQAQQTRTELTPWVSIIPQWETLLKEQTLKDNVEKLGKQWEQNTQLKEQTEKEIEKDQLQLKNKEETQLRQEQELREKNELFQQIQTLRIQRTHDRARLFDGEPTAQIEKKLKQTQSQLEEALQQAITEKQKAEKAEQLNEGKTTQLTLQIKQHTADYETAQQAIEQWLTQQENWDNDKLTLILSTPNATLEAKRNAWQNLIKQKETAETVLGERQRQTTLHRSQPSKPLQTEEACKTAAATNKQTLTTLQERTTEIRALLANHELGKKRIASFEKELKKKSEIYKNWAKLNELYGSQNGAKFKDIAQGYTLDALLAYANQQLHELTGRYELERVPDTLALQIKDLDMLGEIRSVHSLSGGESFLVSLALALGLSALSSNRMNVESLFIDEGFGSLDNETLRTSMDALEHLQTQGRKVGIISHVTDITERIATQVRVIRRTNGKSEVHVKEFI
ncbi:MAG: ATP-dependent exonuclease, partial [Massilibacteroides sp.]|nr:ATP-dependent exonuclease [Massilibacteroides sp.]